MGILQLQTSEPAEVGACTAFLLTAGPLTCHKARELAKAKGSVGNTLHRLQQFRVQLLRAEH